MKKLSDRKHAAMTPAEKEERNKLLEEMVRMKVIGPSDRYQYINWHPEELRAKYDRAKKIYKYERARQIGNEGRRIRGY